MVGVFRLQPGLQGWLVDSGCYVRLAAQLASSIDNLQLTIGIPEVHTPGIQ